MCFICAGGTHEEWHAKLHQHVIDRGFAVVPVGSHGPKESPSDKGWAYTVGLVEEAGHPELVITGYNLLTAQHVLDGLGQRVLDGETLSPQVFNIDFDGTPLGLREVHERHLEGNLMAAWHEYYYELGRSDLGLRALQVVLPDDRHCFFHQTSQPLLDDPTHVAYDGRSRDERRGHSAGGGPIPLRKSSSRPPRPAPRARARRRNVRHRRR